MTGRMLPFLVLCLLIPCVSLAESSGTCGSLTWTLSDDNVLTLSGSGTMSEEDAAEVRASDWVGAEHLVLETGVTSICDNAFLNCSALQSLSLPEGLQSIGQGAFRGCLSLSSVYLPDSVESVGISAFSGCSSLNAVRFSPAMAEVPAYLFENCYSLLGADIPEGVSEIGDGAFADCWSLSEVSLPSTLLFIDNSVFKGCVSLAEITLPDGLMWIGDSAFMNCALGEIAIPDSVSVITQNAFNGVSGLHIRCSLLSVAEGWAGENGFPVILTDHPGAVVVIPEGITSVAEAAFAGTAGQVYCLPEGLVSIGERAFADIASAAYVRIPSTVTDIADSAFDCSDVTLVCYGIYAAAWAESRHFPVAGAGE